MASSTSYTSAIRSRRPGPSTRERLMLILRPSADGLEELQRRANEARQTKSPEEFIRWFRAQSDATKQDMDAKLEELNREVERSEPKREDFKTREEYEEAVGIWMVGGEEAMKGVRSWTDFFVDLVNQIKHWLQNIMDTIKSAVKNAYEKIKAFIDWFSKEVVQACKRKMSEFFESI